MEYLLGLITVVVSALSVWLSKALSANKTLTETNTKLTDMQTVKDDYIVELETRIIDDATGDELADRLNELFAPGEDTDDSVLN